MLPLLHPAMKQYLSDFVPVAQTRRLLHRCLFSFEVSGSRQTLEPTAI